MKSREKDFKDNQLITGRATSEVQKKKIRKE